MVSQAPGATDFRIAPKRPVAPPREANPWWWHPSQAGVRGGPTDFADKLSAVDPDLAITWNAFLERWAIWLRQPKNRYGWTLLFILRDSKGNYIPPDERTLARLYSASQRKWGSAKQYFDSIEREYWRDKEARERRDKQNVIDKAMPAFEHAQIKVSGFGPSNGSKFSNFHK